MKPSVAVIGILRFPPGTLAEVRPHLQALVEMTRGSEGCIAYDVAEDPFEIGLIRFSELWLNHQCLTSHLHAPHITPWRSVAINAGLIERKFTAYDIANSIEV